MELNCSEGIKSVDYSKLMNLPNAMVAFLVENGVTYRERRF